MPWRSEIEPSIESNRLFTFVGRYVVFFQWIEAQIELIILLAEGHDNWERTQTYLARSDFARKASKLVSVVNAPMPFARKNERPEWVAEFADLVSRLEFERRRRNSIVHSQYLFEFLKAGLPAVRSHRQKEDAGTCFSYEQLTEEKTEEILLELAQLAFDISQARVQLTHWYQPN